MTPDQDSSFRSLRGGRYCHARFNSYCQEAKIEC